MTPAETPTECAVCGEPILISIYGHRSCAFAVVSPKRHALIAEKDARIRELVGLIRKVRSIRLWGPGGGASEELLQWGSESKAALARDRKPAAPSAERGE